MDWPGSVFGAGQQPCQGLSFPHLLRSGRPKVAVRVKGRGPGFQLRGGVMAADTDGAVADGAVADGAVADVSLSLETLVSRLLKDDTALKQSLSRLDLEADRLLKLIQPHEAEIRRSATAEAESLSVAEAQLTRAHELERASEDPNNFAWRSIRLEGTTWQSILIAVSVAAGIIFGLSFVPVFPRPLQVALQALAVLIEAVAIRWLVLRQRDERFKTSQQDRQEKRDKYVASLGIEALAAKVNTARETLAHALMTRGLLPVVVQLRTERDQTAYTTRLRYVSARGLSEVYDPTIFEFQTPGFQQIRRILDNTPGGSIGLAGPRGTGKSTVMASFVEGRSRRSDDKRGRAIRVSAPVDYVPRDFILHLFAALCESVIVPAPLFLRPYNEDQPARDIRKFSTANAYRIGSTVFGLLAVLGLILLLNSIFKFWSNWRYWVGPILIAVGVTGWSLCVFTELRERRYRNREADGKAREDEFRQEEERLKRQESKAKPRPGVPEDTADDASNYLDLIRFQQTYTDGWSGSLTATVGFIQGAAGITGSTSYLRNLLSLPDIVSLFKDFIVKVANEGPVIIGIDELDKIERADKAQAFLNDIKSVFGVEKCYFLISISEEALANFERRGLPVRDAFDSALDDVVRVCPLDYPAARDLIRIRVVGLPEPYAAVIYCLSGGLPRDMIRWARSFVVAKDTVGEELTALCKAVIKDDLERKISASIVALSNNSEAGAEYAIRLVGGLELSIEPDWLIDCCYECLIHKGNNSQQPHSTDKVSAGGRDQALASQVDVESRRILSQLFGYFYFVATLIEVFKDDLTKEHFAGLISNDQIGTVRQLAHARQCFSTNPWLAIDKVSSFRSVRGLKRQLTDDNLQPAPPTSSRSSVPGPTTRPDT